MHIFKCIIATGIPAIFLLSVGAAAPHKSIDELMSEAKLRASSSLVEFDALEHPDFEFRNVRVLERASEDRNVCGEVREKNSQQWARFYLIEQTDNVEVEPHPEVDVATRTWFSDQCSAAVRSLRPGQTGAVEGANQCEAAGLFAKAAWENARFAIFYDQACAAN